MPKKSLKKKVSDSDSDFVDDTSAADNEETEKEESRNESKSDNDRIFFKRIRHFDSDRAIVDYSVDLPKISRYLMAVKNARARTIFRIVEQEKSDGTNLAWIPKGKTAQWRKMDEREVDNESALSRWFGSFSVELEVRGSLPANFKGFSVKKPNARKVVEKEPKKRGRPRLKPETEELPKGPPKPRGRPPKIASKKFEKPITLNERLHSLVAESIAQRSLSEKRSAGGSVGIGRRTNNSLNVSLEMDQRPTAVVTQRPFKIPKKLPQTPQQNSANSLPTFKRPKVEPSDFELPANFRDNISVPSPSEFSSPSVRPSSQQRNSFQWAADRPCTSSSFSTLSPLTSREGTFSNSKLRSSLDNSENATNHRNSIENQREKQFSTANTTNGSTAEEKKRKERRRDGPSENEAEEQRTRAAEDNEEEANAVEGHSVISARLPIFTARTFNYEVDVAPAVVKRFESVQAIDILNRLPSPIDPRLKREMPTLDRFVLREGKRHQRVAQAFFCGGPLSALAICPRATKTGRELIAVSTFADETMLKVEKESQDAFVQLWIANPKNNKETARFQCLLRVQKAQHICSLNWCPIFDDDFEFFRKADRPRQRIHQSMASPSTFWQSLTEFSKECLGLLAVGTHNGRINIYSVPFEIESFIDKGKNKSRQTHTLPLIFDSDPLFTLCHPTLLEDVTLNGNNGKTESTKEVTSKANEHGEERMDDKTAFVPSPSADSSVPLLCLNWSPFSGGRYIGAVSPIGHVFIWDLIRPALPTWKLHFDDWNSPPQSICWTEKNKIVISFRRRLFRIYGLICPSESDQFGSCLPILECDLNKTCGVKCFSQPLVFPGLISYESATFSYFGTTQQAPSYIWVTPLLDKESEQDQICASTLSNCHQIQNTCVSVCQLSGLCLSVGADGRMACSLNGRMAPTEEGDGENLMHGRTLIHLIMHNKSSSTESENNQQNFCFSHSDCCSQRRIEVRLGDCALMDQENERVCRRRATEVCPGRRLESLTFCEFSRSCAGLTYCGGESGLVFIVPCTL